MIRAINSVLEQSFEDWELLVIDDGSTDLTKTWEPSDPRIKIIHLSENMGPSGARNLGIKTAQYSWICFLDSDDIWLPSKLSDSSQFIKANSYQVFQSQDIWLKNQKRMYPQKKHKKQSGDILKMAAKLCPVSMSSAVIHKSVFEQVGIFNESFPVCEDYDFWLRVATKFSFGLLDKENVILFAGHEGRVSNRKYIFDEWRLKSLINVEKNYAHNDYQKQILENEILKKTKVLKNGYKKYRRDYKINDLKKEIKHLEIDLSSL